MFRFRTQLRSSQGSRVQCPVSIINGHGLTGLRGLRGFRMMMWSYQGDSSKDGVMLKEGEG